VAERARSAGRCFVVTFKVGDRVRIRPEYLAAERENSFDGAPHGRIEALDFRAPEPLAELSGVADDGGRWATLASLEMDERPVTGDTTLSELAEILAAHNVVIDDAYARDASYRVRLRVTPWIAGRGHHFTAIAPTLHGAIADALAKVAESNGGSR